MSLQYKSIPVTAFAQNCSLVWCDKTMKGVVIDPGGDVEVILQEISKQGIELEKILLTHGHLDHVGGTKALQAKILKADAIDLPIVGPHQADLFWLEGIAQQSQMFGFEPTESFVPNTWLNDGDVVTFGEQRFQVLHTPGHTPGHVVFFNQESELAFVGDVLFQGAIGRTDFPQGDFATLIQSIKQKLWPLGESVRFISGHGPESTFGQERRSNPFVADEMPL